MTNTHVHCTCQLEAHGGRRTQGWEFRSFLYGRAWTRAGTCQTVDVGSALGGRDRQDISFPQLATIGVVVALVAEKRVRRLSGTADAAGDTRC